MQCVDAERAWSATVVDDRELATVRIDALSSPDDRSAERSSWAFVTADPDTHERVVRTLSADELVGATMANVDEPRLLTPDRRCTLYLVPTGSPSRQPFVVVGDSIAAGLVAGEDQRRVLAGDAADRGVRLVVDGQPGAPWTELEVPGDNLDDELRGARSFAPDVAIATVLGANDAIIAALTPEPDKQAQRRRTDDRIGAFVADARRAGRCVVLTTPPDLPIVNFDLYDSYATEARRIGDVLRAHGAVDPGVIVVDFAEVSRPHHLDDGEADDWFDGEDELHPNAEGSAALTALLLDAADACRAIS